tara:strand:- start:707 stop:1906 length:1200 start_codon:yes stop_codon:yes gene_type:complete
MAAVRGLQLAMSGERGLIVCGREFMNSLDDSSMAEVKEAIASEPWLTEGYEVGERYIRTKTFRGARVDFAFIGLHKSLASLKSKARIHILWVDEAEEVSAYAWQIAIPTVREASSEIWVTWNPGRKKSPTHLRFRVQAAGVGDVKIVEMNWRDNPYFPAVLERDRLEDKEKRPDQYDHIWEGEFVTIQEGAYFSSGITLAKEQGRIGNVAPDPLMTMRAAWDIGGTGAKADLVSIIIQQWIGREIRILDHYSAQGQPLSVHIGWLRKKGYEDALCMLPHDGDTHDKVHDVSYNSALQAAGFHTQIIPNQGRGAAMLRVEASRRMFPSIWFNERTTAPLLESLGWYHAKIDKERGIDLGPDHDFSSNDADAFGLGCVAYEAPLDAAKPKQVAYAQGGWMN